MKLLSLPFALVVVGSLFFSGCHRHEPDDHAHGDETSHGHSHGDDAKSFSGATHKEGTGITLLSETKQRLGVELVDVEEKLLPKEISFSARVFLSETNKQFLASGVIDSEQIKLIAAGSPVQLKTAGGVVVSGTVTHSTRTASTNEAEVVVRFRTEDSTVADGSFLRATAKVAAGEPVTTIPRDALIRSPTETFVYVQNGDAYLRTLVEAGREIEGLVEIKDGLLEGDSVVKRGAMDLWFVELRAVKGGQGCCPAPPVKGKK